MTQKNKAGSMILGVAFVWFTTHFGGGFASGAQIYSYYVRYGIWCLIMPAGGSKRKKILSTVPPK